MLWISIAMFAFGLVVLSSGKFAFSDTKKVTGPPARISGLLCTIPLILDVVKLFVLSDMQFFRRIGIGTLVLIDSTIVVLVLTIVITITVRAYKVQNKAAKAEVAEMSQMISDVSLESGSRPFPDALTQPPPPPLPQQGEETNQ